MSTARLACGDAANIGERNSWTQSEFCIGRNSVRKQEPFKMYNYIVHVSPEDGETSYKVWLTSVERRRCSNEAKTRNPLKSWPTAGWIRMPLGTEVGLGPGDIVLDGDPAPPRKVADHTPHFSAHVCCGQTVAHLSNCWALVINTSWIRVWLGHLWQVGSGLVQKDWLHHQYIGYA